ncbi:MAG TPA: bifunctional YncE family protein/alkaline phosphatase family protein [Bryobacteraceae bacterium]|nr:bifunctional YncE family protein/alkaline phosphatase family protein [Bryobacteraceae bacterium]
MPAEWRSLSTLSVLMLSMAGTLPAQSLSAPAGIRPALRRSGASILPGGRVILPFGDEYATGPGAFGLVVSPSGRTALTSNTGPGVNSLTVLEREKTGRFQSRQLILGPPEGALDFDASDWRGVFMGLALSGERAAYISEGNSGRISLLDWNTERRRTIDLNQAGYDDSFSGDLALDADRGILYAVDQANFRVAAIDIKTRQTVANVRVGRLPFALALSPDRRKLYVTNLGMFQYQALAGADRSRAKATGLPFPAFGFPSPEAAAGAERHTESGTVKVPGLGDPNVPQSNSLAVVDISTPASAKLVTFVHTGLPFGAQSLGGSSPSGVVATADRVFVSNAADDSVTVIDAKTNQVAAEIPIRIPGLENLRGVLPMGMAYHEASGWLLVAEAGINAVGVIDTRQNRVLGHIPAAWFPTRVAIQGDTVYVANARGHGTGPNAQNGFEVTPRQLHQGSLSVFTLPKAADLPALTTEVLDANGFRPRPTPDPPLPAGIRHVVLIVKENRTYDEVFGDIARASNGPAMSAPSLARIGMHGYLDGQGRRLSLRDAEVTPNHHALASQWSFSDNFYADSDVSVDGHHWLAGSPPNAWTESSLLSAYTDKKDFRIGEAPGRLLFAGSDASVHPEDQLEGGTIWHHFARHGISFYNFGEGFELAGVAEDRDLEPTGARFLTNVPMPEPLFRNTSREYPGFNMNIPDQYRASQFIKEIDEKYAKAGVDLPQFLFVHLPNDHMTKPRPDDGYPYQESFVADNDYALGRIVQYLSQSKWWKDMAVFVTEDDAQGGLDHLDAHRTLLLCLGPYARRDYVSHVNTSFPGLLKTIFRLLKLPPLNLFDAAASDLSDCFTNQPDPAGYRLRDVDRRIFDPATAHQAPEGTPSPRMDDPRDMDKRGR